METNYETIRRHLNELTCDILVLPELCTCGYLFDHREQLLKRAERVPDGAFVRKMVELSQLHQCAIIAGMAELDDGAVYNTAVIVDSGKYVGKYRKIHLSDYEKTLFKRGDRNEVFEVKGIKVGVQICFDLWFPEMAREQMLQSADLFCALANFGGETSYHIARIRAIENLTPMVLCNRIGAEKSSTMEAGFLGMSSIIDSTGVRLIPGKEKVGYADASEIKTNAVRSNIICRDFREEARIHLK